MTTHIYAARELTAEKHTADAGEKLATIEHDVPLDLLLNGLQTGHFVTSKPTKADVAAAAHVAETAVPAAAADKPPEKPARKPAEK